MKWKTLDRLSDILSVYLFIYFNRKPSFFQLHYCQFWSPGNDIIHWHISLSCFGWTWHWGGCHVHPHVLNSSAAYASCRPDAVLGGSNDGHSLSVCSHQRALGLSAATKHRGGAQINSTVSCFQPIPEVCFCFFFTFTPLTIISIVFHRSFLPPPSLRRTLSLLLMLLQSSKNGIRGP